MDQSLSLLSLGKLQLLRIWTFLEADHRVSRFLMILTIVADLAKLHAEDGEREKPLRNTVKNEQQP